jgi:hypothetical protein
METINTAIYGNVMRSAISELSGMLIQDVEDATNSYAEALAKAESALSQAGPAASAAQSAADTANQIVQAMGDIVLIVGGEQPAPISGKKIIWFSVSEV